MHRVKIIGAGQLGSRHLQALQAVRYPLEIHVVDPSSESLSVAKERYEYVQSSSHHEIFFEQQIRKTGRTDIAIVATNSDTRRRAIEGLLEASDVKYLFLEKLLFNKIEDFTTIDAMITDRGIGAWVNCPMRVMPVYEKIRADLRGTPISYRVTGSQFGLVTNAIHYIDHMAHLTDCDDFVLDTRRLDPNPMPSKRSGFLEFNGTLTAHFSNGNSCEMTCYPSGSSPVVVELFSDRRRYIVRESEGNLWYSGEDTKWSWEEQEAKIPYQSEITTGIVESLLSSGKCGLAPYNTSMRIHLALLTPLSDIVRQSYPDILGYPFT